MIKYDKEVKDELKSKAEGEDIYTTTETTEYHYFEYSNDEATSGEENKNVSE
jgi:hypothetical protein